MAAERLSSTSDTKALNQRRTFTSVGIKDK